jgi:indole-3-glycerol phosphate synthase
MSILDTIVLHKKEEVRKRKANIKESSLIDSDYFLRKCNSLSEAIRNGSGVIAEFKRKSPSKPAINMDSKTIEVVPAYENAGVSASSILTDTTFFGGSDQDILSVRPLVKLPILRKEFIVDPYQILEAKAIGADAILLIAEVLTKSEISELSSKARDLGLEVLLEIHTSDQIEKFNEAISCIGVNNRNLKNFHIDIQHSIDMLPKLPSQAVKVSESGISNPATVIQLREIGYQGFLIGENFMKTSNPGESCKHFIDEILSKE